MRQLAPILVVALLISACSGGKSSPTSPSTPTPTPTPAPTVTTYTITGLVTVNAAGATTGQTLSGATVSIADGPNAGKSATTDGSGRYTISGLTFAGMSGTATAPGYTSMSKGISLVSGVTSTTINWQVLPQSAFSRGGTGDNVFDMPTYVSRVRVQADYAQYTSNFQVYVAGRLLVNELIGTGWGTTHFDGTYLTSGGTVEIRNSSGVRWLLQEVR